MFPEGTKSPPRTTVLYHLVSYCYPLLVSFHGFPEWKDIFIIVRALSLSRNIGSVSTSLTFMKLKQSWNHPLSVFKKNSVTTIQKTGSREPYNESSIYEINSHHRKMLTWTMHLGVEKQPETHCRPCQWALAFSGCFFINPWPTSWRWQGTIDLCIHAFLLMRGLMGECGCHGFIFLRSDMIKFIFCPHIQAFVGSSQSVSTDCFLAFYSNPEDILPRRCNITWLG